MPHTHTQRHVCILIAAALQRCCSHKSCRVQRPPAKCKYLRNMPLGRQQAACSRRQAACSIRQTGCVGDIHSSFDLYRLATCNMRRCICARLRPPLFTDAPLAHNLCRLIVIKIGFLHAPVQATSATGRGTSGRGDEGCGGRGRGRVLPKRFAAWKTVSLRFAYVCDISRFSFSVCGRFGCLGPRNCTLHSPQNRYHAPHPPSQSSTRRFAAVSQFAICELLISTHSLISVSCSRWPANRQNGGTTKRLRVGFRVAAAGHKATRP